MRRKVIPRAQFEPVIERQMRPVILVGDAAPDFYYSIPGRIRCSIIASGEVCTAGLRGGIDVIRHSPDDPVPFNRDAYRIVDLGDPEFIYVEGPFMEEGNHHIREIPYTDAEVIGDPTKIKARLI